MSPFAKTVRSIVRGLVYTILAAALIAAIYLPENIVNWLMP